MRTHKYWTKKYEIYIFLENIYNIFRTKKLIIYSNLTLHPSAQILLVSLKSQRVTFRKNLIENWMQYFFHLKKMLFKIYVSQSTHQISRKPVTTHNTKKEKNAKVIVLSAL